MRYVQSKVVNRGQLPVLGLINLPLPPSIKYVFINKYTVHKLFIFYVNKWSKFSRHLLFPLY